MARHLLLTGRRARPPAAEGGAAGSRKVKRTDTGAGHRRGSGGTAKIRQRKQSRSPFCRGPHPVSRADSGGSLEDSRAPTGARGPSYRTHQFICRYARLQDSNMMDQNKNGEHDKNVTKEQSDIGTGWRALHCSRDLKGRG